MIVRDDEPLEGDAARAALDRFFGRAAEPEEVANVAVFLASERAGYVSGCVVRVDGGALYRR